MAAQNGGAQNQIVLAVVEQEDFDRFFFRAAVRHYSFVPLPRMARASSGNLVKAVTLRSHCLWSNAGEPLTMEPAGISPCVPLCAVTITPSPILQCPATPTCPARITFLPSSVEPARPTWAHSMEFSATMQLCPT